MRQPKNAQQKLFIAFLILFVALLQMYFADWHFARRKDHQTKLILREFVWRIAHPCPMLPWERLQRGTPNDPN